ncbi:MULTISPECIES: YbaK/EbsC family protein [unclassified Caballeronia]|uniref:YbaK/EbsC family protein n=1 Tax=unclassified Caballeronia TaxID=2646786 RepID=UPI00285851C9|nr:MULTISPECIES: YbaK/EbsC family protein [unclassified Caballeronia]MDR5755121.1 hypothetical protein [Caballeronia sp. LZ024]MDR5845331.1 hypothetical protein [Caballeronia sp. LZ031]
MRYKKDRTGRYACIVTPATRRLDVNSLVKCELAAERISFASREVATELSGMKYCGITAFGLPDTWPIPVKVTTGKHIAMGAAVREAKFLLSPQRLVCLAEHGGGDARDLIDLQILRPGKSTLAVFIRYSINYQLLERTFVFYLSPYYLPWFIVTGTIRPVKTIDLLKA